MSRVKATVTFTLNTTSSYGGWGGTRVSEEDIRSALSSAAGGYDEYDVRDITVTALEPVAEPVTVDATEYAAFLAWRRETGRE